MSAFYIQQAAKAEWVAPQPFRLATGEGEKTQRVFNFGGWLQQHELPVCVCEAVYRTSLTSSYQSAFVARHVAVHVGCRRRHGRIYSWGRKKPTFIIIIFLSWIRSSKNSAPTYYFWTSGQVGSKQEPNFFSLLRQPWANTGSKKKKQLECTVYVEMGVPDL